MALERDMEYFVEPDDAMVPRSASPGGWELGAVTRLRAQECPEIRLSQRAVPTQHTSKSA
jgi:hypothetical protein